MCSASLAAVASAVSFTPAPNRRLHFTGEEESLHVKKIIMFYVMHLKGKERHRLHKSTVVGNRCI